MCFYTKQTKTAIELENRFNATAIQPELIKPQEIISGFTYPLLPVITEDEPGIIQCFHWGLIPGWAKDKSIQQNTLNARSETIGEKPAFRNYFKQRCKVLVNGFYEWKWLDEKGKKKQKYLIGLADENSFGLDGIWSKWVDKQTGAAIHTFSILTEAAQGFMTEIHNSKMRMPVISQPLTIENLNAAAV